MAREAEMHADQLKGLMANLNAMVQQHARKAADDYFTVSAQAAIKIFNAKLEPLLAQVRGALEGADQLAPDLKKATHYVERDLALWLVGGRSWIPRTAAGRDVDRGGVGQA